MAGTVWGKKMGWGPTHTMTVHNGIFFFAWIKWDITSSLIKGK